MDGFIVKWFWTPWPESVARKLEVGKTIPKDEAEAGVGPQHTRWVMDDTPKATQEIMKARKGALSRTNTLLHDLCNDSIVPNTKTRFRTRMTELFFRKNFEFWNVTLDLVAMKRIFHAVTGNYCEKN